MRARVTTLIALLALWAGVVSGQEWETLEMSGFRVDFPAENIQSVTSSGRIYTYDGGNIYMTVTSLPDTSNMPEMTQLERARFYAATTATVVRRLGGRLLDVRDTMIGDHQLHFSVVAVTYNDTAVTQYELLQYHNRDTLHGFSCQYETFNSKGVAMRDRFFNSIDLDPGSKISRGNLYAVGGLVIVILAFITGFAWYRRALLKQKVRR